MGVSDHLWLLTRRYPIQERLPLLDLAPDLAASVDHGVYVDVGVAGPHLGDEFGEVSHSAWAGGGTRSRDDVTRGPGFLAQDPIRRHCRTETVEEHNDRSVHASCTAVDMRLGHVLYVRHDQFEIEGSTFLAELELSNAGGVGGDRRVLLAAVQRRHEVPVSTCLPGTANNNTSAAASMSISVRRMNILSSISRPLRHYMHTTLADTRRFATARGAHGPSMVIFVRAGASEPSATVPRQPVTFAVEAWPPSVGAIRCSGLTWLAKSVAVDFVERRETRQL